MYLFLELAKNDTEGIRGYPSREGLILYYNSSSYDVIYTDDLINSSDRLVVISPNSFDSDYYIEYGDSASLIASLATNPQGVNISGNGTITYLGVSKTVSSVTPYSDSSRMYFSDSTNVLIAGFVPLSGTFTLTSRPDLVESTTLTPQNSTDDIGKTTDKFRDAHFSGTVNSGALVLAGEANGITNLHVSGSEGDRTAGAFIIAELNGGSTKKPNIYDNFELL